MSDSTQGPGWWQASDGKWYPPAVEDAVAGAEAPSAPPPSDQPIANAPVEAADTPAPQAPQPSASGTEPPAGGPPPPGPTPDDQPKRPRRGVLIAIAIAVVVLLLTAVAVVASSGGSDKKNVSTDASSTDSSTGGDSSSGSGSGSGSSDISDEMPSPDIKLTDDVVVVDSKQGKMFKGYSNDGKSLLLDKSAPGIDQLKAGKILLLSGNTVVRATQVDDTADGIAVTGAPATLPEVVANGELSWNDVSYDPGKVRVFVYGDTSAGSGSSGGGGGGSTPDSSILDQGGAGIINGLGGASFRPGGGPVVATPVAFAGQQKTVSGKIGDFSFNLTHEAEGSGHHLVLDARSAGDLVGTIKVDVHLGALSTSGGSVVQDRQVRNFDFELAALGGEATITTDLQSTKQLTHVKTPAFFKIPFGIEFPALVGGIPFTLSLTGTFQVQLAMALAGARLGGRADITFGGDAGFHFKDGALTVNGTRQQDAPDLLNTVKGLANGPVGVVVTTELPKVGFGFGFLQTGAGVYLSSGTVIAQTILPPPPACTSTQIAYVLAGGVEAKFLGKSFDLGRKAVVDKRWDYTVPQTQQCLAKPN